jgi:hypothetical protein
MNLTRSIITSLSGSIFFLINLQRALESSKIINIMIVLSEENGRLFLNAGSMSGCLCPGDILTYQCTVVGRGLTVWIGNAFICPSNNNEIALLHRRFESENGTSNSCNNGAIVGRSLAVEGNNYTSQLNVTITPETAGTTVECISDNGTTTMLIFSLLIPSTG